MKKTSKNFLIISLIIVATSGAYLYFSNDINSEKIVPVALGSSLVSSAKEDVMGTLDNKITADIAFLTTLVSLKKITIDTVFFDNVFFNALKNNTVKIEPVLPGRVNPFSPIESIGGRNNIVGSNVVTDQPTQLTDKTAVLNGIINTTTGVTNIYFQYGVSEQILNNTTDLVSQSMVGTFIKNISGLTPKTTYFYKACAKINNLTVCGETVSFTTK